MDKTSQKEYIRVALEAKKICEDKIKYSIKRIKGIIDFIETNIEKDEIENIKAGYDALEIRISDLENKINMLQASDNASKCFR